MFEEATWARRNRRAFAVTERLKETAGVTIDPYDGIPQDERDLALLFANTVGSEMFIGSSVVFTAKDGEKNKRGLSRIYKAMTPQSGARAYLLLTRAVARFLMHPAVRLLDSDRWQAELVDLADHAVADTYALPPEDREFLDAAFDRGTEGADLNRTGAIVSLRAIELAAGHETARSLPPFDRLGDIDWKHLFETQNFEWASLVDITSPRVWQHGMSLYSALANRSKRAFGVDRIVVGLIREEGASPKRCEGILNHLRQRYTVEAGGDDPFIDVTLAAERYDAGVAAVTSMMEEADPEWSACFRFGKR